MPKSRDACRVVCTAATWLVWLYFEAALVAPPPAAAGPDTSTAAARMASVPVMVAFNIAISIRFETTQTEQTSAFPVRRAIGRRVVPANQDDPAGSKAQETISICMKNQQIFPPVKNLPSLIIF
jgi:hypothetical protein